MPVSNDTGIFFAQPIVVAGDVGAGLLALIPSRASPLPQGQCVVLKVFAMTPNIVFAMSPVHTGRGLG